MAYSMKLNCVQFSMHRVCHKVAGAGSVRATVLGVCREKVQIAAVQNAVKRGDQCTAYGRPAKDENWQNTHS